ncbi:MAG: type III pantothenate kinase [Acidimicrobiales bacterium]
MLLAVDIGNTQTVIGVFEDDDWELTNRKPGELPGLLHHWRISTVRDRTADEFAIVLDQLLRSAGIALMSDATASEIRLDGQITGVVVSSSVPTLTSAMREMAETWFDVPFVVIGPGIRTGMPILYDNPREVGADRIANGVAAADLFGGPAIVVDFGTSTNFDVVSAAGEYMGGAIAVGLEVSMDALFEHAAALPRIELVAPSAVIGRSTVTSMQIGAIFGHAGLVDGICRRILAELGDATVVGTGGLVEVVAPHTEYVRVIEPWLTLHGLRVLYVRNTDDAASR